ncbi:MAG: AAA family ATPase [Proteobacteria bacterium]|nr:AAA family ATPase [Pseudomonadota bacterium]
MSNQDLPAGHEFMSLDAKERASRVRGARRRQQEVLARIGPRAFTPNDGLWEPSAWDGNIPARLWIIPGLIPMASVTMLTGNGGEGKSLLAAQLAAAAVTHSTWLGYEVRQVRALMIHAEDDKDEITRRSDGLLKPSGRDMRDLDGLTMLDRDGDVSSIMYEAMGQDVTGRFTEFYERTWSTVQTLGAQLLILDSLYNFFGGNENIRSQVNEFIGGLKRLAKKLNCAVVLVAHPSRAGMTSGAGDAGSTAWHNAVRSRLYLHRKKHPSGDPDEKGPLVLEPMKSNYGALGEAIPIAFEGGRFVLQSDLAAIAEGPRRWENE